jgi:hypothetical protein
MSMEHGMQIIANGILKTGNMNAFDRSEDDILWVEDKNADAEGDSESVPEQF